MNLKEHVLASVLPDTYYQKRFPQWNARNRPNISCVFGHEDKKPSLSIGLRGGGARCHSCGRSIGNIVHFESEKLGIEEAVAATRLYSEFIRPIVPDQIVAGLQLSLAKNTKIRSILESDCGITAAGITMFALGWDAATKRLAIPVEDNWSNVVNIRLYKIPAFRNAKDDGTKTLNLKGYGGNDLFSWPHFTKFVLDKPVFVMPSEKEMILGMQFGLQCVCSTAGEQSWDDKWAEWFTGYDICIVAQRDDVGRSSAAKRLASLQTVANYCAIVEPDTEHKDFADYVVKDGGQGLHLLAKFRSEQQARGSRTLEGKQIAQNPDPIFPSDNSPAKPEYFNNEIVELASIGSKPEMLNQTVRTHGIVAAKATNTYTIPWKFKIKLAKDAQRFYSIPLGRVLLSFVKASDAQIRAAIREILADDKADISPYDFVTATEVEVIPTASIDKDVPYVTQRCFYIGERIEANVPYELEIVPTTAVGTQETIGLIVKAIPIARAIEAATFTDEDVAALQLFKPSEEEEVWDKLMTIAHDLAQHNTKIYNRPDWHLVALLTWLSPLGWMFPYEKEIQRGWLNTLAIGDTQTGKSKVTQTYQRLFRAGSIINAENCTYVGLVGGAVKMGSGQFMLRWGRIPLSDKQLVVIEELSGLSIDEISNMSDVRSSGIARLDKGGLSAETNARTRILALSNVRPVNKNLASYLSGVKAIQELIGHGEDIARFDLIVTLTDREVSNEVINRPHSKKGDKDAIPDETWQLLCQFIWALKPNQIKITTDAYFLCLDETKRLAEKYHPSIPVFKGGSGRYKIARIACSIACLQVSWNGKVILVHEEHVLAASRFLELLYDKDSFGYNKWSEAMFDRDRLKGRELLDEKIKELLRAPAKRAAVCETLIHSSKFTRDELCAVASLQISAADDFIGVMLRSRVLSKGEANVWDITPAGRDWLASHLNDTQ